MNVPNLPMLPSLRKEGWIHHGDRVVVVIVEKVERKHRKIPDIRDFSFQVTVRTGHIASTSESHIGIDNTEKTIVWGDKPFRENMDSADDAYEKSFEVNDRHLLKNDDAVALRHLSLTHEWFSEYKYPPHVIRKICADLLSLSLWKEKTEFVPSFTVVG